VRRAIELATAAGRGHFEGTGARDTLDALVPGDGPWEVEIGFGKGHYLLARAAESPERRFLGIEVAGEYFRLVARRLERRRLGNVLLLGGEALALLATRLPSGFAARMHVYFPDPWPKKRHLRRRLLAPGSVDVVLGALAPGGCLEFATDHPDYGAVVRDLLAGQPGVEVAELADGWPGGPRTNYERKYVVEGRPIVRLVVWRRARIEPHPAGLRGLLAASSPAAGADDPESEAP